MATPSVLTPALAGHLLPPALTAAISVLIGGWLLWDRQRMGWLSVYLLLVLVAGVAWQAQILLHLLTTDPTLARFLATSEKFTGFLAGFLWLVFVGEYTDSTFHRRSSVQVVLAAIVGGFVLFAVTNPLHGLLMAEIRLVQTPFVHATVVRGPVYFGFLAITYAFVVYGLFVLVRFLSWTRPGTHLRIALFATGAVCVSVGNLSSIAGLGPVTTFQYGGYGAFPFILATTVGIFGVGLFDLAPVARTALVETLADAVIVVDERHRVVDYNGAAVSLWPSLPEREGDPLETACPPLADEVEFSADDRTTRVTLTVDGEPTHFSLVVSAVDSEQGDGRVVGHSILLRDVTDLEASRRRLEAQNRRLDQVAATISHDLRNPLNVASGYVELLDADLDDDAREYTDAVRDSHDRMEEIIDDVLALARQGEEVTDPTPVGLEVIAREAWTNVETGEATLDVDGSKTVLADRSRLLTLFENLVRNAVEHSSTGSQNASRPDDAVEHASTNERPRTSSRSRARENGSTGSYSRPSGDDDSNAAVTVTVEAVEGGFAVRDDGPGIDADVAADVFEYGYSTSDDGHGLGLAIVETVVDSHGWTVELDTDHDGARFVFGGVETAAPDEARDRVNL